MERRSRKKAVTFTEEKKKKITYFVAVPAVVLVLILVIIGVGGGNGKRDKDKNPVESSLTESSAVDGTQSGENAGADETTAAFDLSAVQLKQDEIPELTALVQEYCQAKTDGDPERLYRVFGKTDLSEEQRAEEQAKMDRLHQVVEGYENISCYFVDGLEPATYVIYPYFEIRYKDAQMMMPSLTWSYVRRDENGTFYMTQEVSDSEGEYIAKVSMLEDIRNLSAQVETQKTEALNSDAVLQQIYMSMGTGPACVDTPETEIPQETEESMTE